MRTWLTLLLLLAVACLAAFTWQWLVHDPGYVLVRYGATSVETTLVFAIVAVALAVVAVRLVWRALGAPLAAWSRRRRRRGRERIAAGFVALDEGRYAQALRELERAAQHTGLQTPALLAAARAAQARGDRQRAAALLARTPGTAPLVLRARFELDQGNPAAAFALLRAAAEKSALPPAGCELLVEAALASGDPAAALAALPALVRSQALAPAALAAVERRVVAAALAAAPDRERLDRLWSGLGRAQRHDPAAIAAYARRAAALGQVLAGMSEIEAGLRRAWSEPLIVAYGELGPAEAGARLRYAEGCIAAQPDSAGLALTLGRLCNLERQWSKARGYLEHGIEVAPSPALWEALGDCAEGQGDPAAASRAYRNALLAARGERTQTLPQLAHANALSTRAVVAEERSEHGVPRLPGAVSR